jgi:hypothetical protein
MALLPSFRRCGKPPGWRSGAGPAALNGAPGLRNNRITIFRYFPKAKRACGIALAAKAWLLAA